MFASAFALIPLLLGMSPGFASRNWQARMALRSRDDLADLHFAEWRVPYAVQEWRRRARASRCENKRFLLAFLENIHSIWDIPVRGISQQSKVRVPTHPTFRTGMTPLTLLGAPALGRVSTYRALVLLSLCSGWLMASRATSKKIPVPRSATVFRNHPTSLLMLG